MNTASISSMTKKKKKIKTENNNCIHFNYKMLITMFAKSVAPLVFIMVLFQIAPWGLKFKIDQVLDKRWNNKSAPLEC
jgi:hypothetical protein